MQTWALLQFALALWVVISGLALIISQLHIIERSEQQEWLTKLKQSIDRQL
jgi:hypothetical protein